MKAKKPDTARILGQLKDFQLATVEHVFQRMYLDPEPTTRYLVADEVGLGKTLVARGLIAKAVDHMWKDIDRIDVVYICSNGDIARQNINRLNITQDRDFEFATRITLLPVQLSGMREKKLNFVSFTPGTSFDQKSGTGISQERKLLYWLLKEPWQLKGRAPLNVLQMDVVNTDRWRERIRDFESNHPIDEELRRRFTQQIRSRKDLAKRFHALCEVFYNKNHRATREERKEQKSVIGELRHELALSCLKALEPDFIIMDEFQRFRHLLNADGEESELARALFDYTDDNTQARVLLLSATPYKMYTMDHERGQEDHHEDFLHTYRFLSNSDEETEHFRLLLKRYRDTLFQMHASGTTELIAAKRDVERLLRKYIVRTERLAITENRDGMLRQLDPPEKTLSVKDIHAYISYDSIAALLKHGDVMEFWKSAPYLLNFMEKYVFKQSFEKGMLDADTRDELLRIVKHNAMVAISPGDVRRYVKIDPANARLRALKRDVIDNEAWKLLWLPPSRSYYAPSRKSVYAQEGVQDFTKRLVFSAWNVVPKVISALLSYEAERLMSRFGDAAVKNTAQERKRRRPLLRFARSKGRLTGMNVLGLITPCLTFAREIDPLRMIDADGALPTAAEVLQRTESIIRDLLEDLPSESSSSGAEDDDWYWAAIVLLDMQHAKRNTQAWFNDAALHRSWIGANIDDASEDSSAWRDHVQVAQEMVRDIMEGTMRLGRRPADLVRILALVALAGPGTVAIRSFLRVMPAGEKRSTPVVRNAAGQLGFAFLSLFNTPESTSLLRGLKLRGAYWQRVLEYSFEGNLQSVMDEYFHFMMESEGLTDKSVPVIAEKLVREISPVIAMRTSRLAVDDIRRVGEKGLARLEDFGRIRYALRFQDERNDATGEKTRQDLVRHAFNSPFHPFVLASTSIGQEGLDFHAYCHAVVHWNLPSNPVDLEQREGRVHRYKGHAIRKNIALRYRHLPLNGQRDIWRSMFERALADRSAADNDLVPYWLFPVENGAVIERHVPHLPLSRDKERLHNLRRSLTMYRMVFGQSRQEDMIAYLLKTVPEEEITQMLEEIVIDLSPGEGE
jgi:hypothetical protein